MQGLAQLFRLASNIRMVKVAAVMTGEPQSVTTLQRSVIWYLLYVIACVRNFYASLRARQDSQLILLANTHLEKRQQNAQKTRNINYFNMSPSHKHLMTYSLLAHVSPRRTKAGQ